MTGKPSELPLEAREAIGAALRRAREAAGMTREDLAFAISEGADVIDGTWFQHIESGSPYPFANPLRLMRTMRRLGLSWQDLLEAGGLWDETDECAKVFRE